MNRKITGVFLVLAIASYTILACAQFPHQIPNNTIRWGKGGSSVNKILEADVGDGATNPKITVPQATKDFRLTDDLFVTGLGDFTSTGKFGGDLTSTGNNYTLGDGAATIDKDIVADIGNGGTNPKIRYNITNSEWEKTDDGSVFTPISGGAGVSADPADFNNVSNSQAEEDTTGWVIYADAAGSSPVDGTGGSPNITFPRETSLPIRQTGSFKIVKDAVNRQGEGVSFDLKVDKADLGSRILVRFEYEVSANYADDDIGIFIENVDTPGIITPLNKDVKDASGYHVIEFDTDATDDDYRLIIHIASVNALAYDFIFDNVKVIKLAPEASITSSDNRVMNRVSAKIDNNGSDCVVVAGSEMGDWIDDAATIRGSLANCNIKINTGTFSATPVCTATAFNNDSNLIALNVTSPTDTNTTTWAGASHVTTDVIFFIECHGPK